MEPENVEVGDTVEDRFTGNLCTVTEREKVESHVYVQLESVHGGNIGIESRREGIGTRHVNDLNPL